MRRQFLVANLAAGQVWPDVTGDLQEVDDGFSWVHIENRGPADVVCGLSGKPTAALDGFDFFVPAGEELTKNIAGPHDPKALRLVVVNTGTVPTTLFIEVADAPIVSIRHDIPQAGTSGVAQPVSIAGQPVSVAAAAGAAGVMRVNAGGPGPGQSNKTFTGNVSIATGATVALETVATGKTLYITDISLTSNTATPFLVQIQAGGVTIWQGYVKGDTGPIELPGLETQPTASAGQAVTLVAAAAAATTLAFFVGGVEQ